MTTKELLIDKDGFDAERNVVDRVVQGTAYAYRQGYRGYYRGDRYADCPYPEGRKERAAWLDGIRDARTDGDHHNRRDARWS